MGLQKDCSMHMGSIGIIYRIQMDLPFSPERQIGHPLWKCYRLNFPVLCLILPDDKPNIFG